MQLKDPIQFILLDAHEQNRHARAQTALLPLSVNEVGFVPYQLLKGDRAICSFDLPAHSRLYPLEQEPKD